MNKDFKDWIYVKNNTPLLDEIVYDKYIPKQDMHMNSLPIGRTEEISVKRKNWVSIKDKSYPDEYVMCKSVKSYFVVGIYMVNKIGSITISPNETRTKTTEFRLTSSIRNTTNTNFRIENTVTAGITGEYTLQDTLLTVQESGASCETSDEKSKTLIEGITYESMLVARNIVYWEFSKIIALFREDNKGKFDIMCFNDYHIDTKSATYLDEGKLEKMLEKQNTYPTMM